MILDSISDVEAIADSTKLIILHIGCADNHQQEIE